MDIKGVSRAEPATIRRTDRGRTSGGTFSLNSAPAEAPAPMAAPTPLAATDALIALQEQSEGVEQRRHSLKRGRNMLDLLDELRHGLLTGTISAAALTDLVVTIQAERGTVADCDLAGVLGEIELRARVELAKLGRYP